MNTNFAEWYRIANIQPEHNQLQARWQGIEYFCAEKLDSSDVLSLVRRFFSLSTPESFQEKFTESFFKADNAFPRSNNSIELAVLAGAALVHIAENDLHDLRILTSLAMKTAAFERKVLVPGIYLTINQLFYNDSRDLRNNPTLNKPIVNVPSLKSLQENLKVAEDSNTWSTPGGTAKQLNAYLSSLEKAFSQVKNALFSSISAQDIYREDSQILWWLTGEYSKDADKPFKMLKAAEASLLIGKELADLIERRILI